MQHEHSDSDGRNRQQMVSPSVFFGFVSIADR